MRDVSFVKWTKDLQLSIVCLAASHPLQRVEVQLSSAHSHSNGRRLGAQLPVKVETDAQLAAVLVRGALEAAKAAAAAEVVDA